MTGNSSFEDRSGSDQGSEGFNHDPEPEYIPGSEGFEDANQNSPDGLESMLRGVMGNLDEGTQSAILSVARPLCDKISNTPVSSTLKWGGAVSILSGFALDYANLKINARKGNNFN